MADQAVRNGAHVRFFNLVGLANILEQEKLAGTRERGPNLWHKATARNNERVNRDCLSPPILVTPAPTDGIVEKA